MLPVALLDLLNTKLAFANSKWAKDRAGNAAAVALPPNIARLFPTVGTNLALVLGRSTGVLCDKYSIGPERSGANGLNFSSCSLTVCPNHKK